MGERGMRGQRGLLVLDILVFASFIFAFLGVAAYVTRELSLNNSATQAGRFATQVASAVRAKLAAEAVLVTPVGTPQTGVAWLKSATDCAAQGGTSARPYMHLCDFPSSTQLGMNVSTTITVSGTNVVATMTLGPMDPAYGTRHDLLQSIARVINMGDPTNTTPLTNTFFNAVADTASMTVVTTVTNDATTDIYIRADGQRVWDGDQNVNSVNLDNVGSIDGTGDVEMARFVDSDDNLYLLDPDGTAGGINRIKNDVYLDWLNNGAGDYLSNHVVHSKGVVTQGGLVTIPTCPNGAPEIHGSVASLVATDNVTYPSPKNIKGFNLYAAVSGASWILRAKAFIDDDAKNYEVIPPDGAAWVQINYWTTCS